MDDTPRRRWTVWRILGTLLLYGFAAVLLAGVIGGIAAFLAYDYVTQPGKPGRAVAVTVPEGATGQEIGQLLTDAGLIEHPGFFRLAMRIDGGKAPLRHGAYSLHEGLSPLQLLERLQKGPEPGVAGAYKLTVPEGLTIAQIAELFDDREGFLAAASDPARIARLGLEAETLEGFLMPNTYFFDEAPAPGAAVDRMLEQFEKERDRLMKEIPEAAAFDLLQVVTVASLVEEEAKTDEERPLVAAVLYNRLKKGMPLQMDSTLQYALRKYGQRMLDADKRIDSPYNTYQHAGLPPGPISNPGAASLRAALKPADVNYLFFVSNADGRTHTFSATLDEHERAVARFRREIAVQRRALEEERGAQR